MPSCETKHQSKTKRTDSGLHRAIDVLRLPSVRDLPSKQVGAGPEREIYG